MSQSISGAALTPFEMVLIVFCSRSRIMVSPYKLSRRNGGLFETKERFSWLG